MQATVKRVAAIFVVGLGVACAAASQETGAAAEKVPVLPEIALDKVLVIEPVGRYRRSAVHTDALEALLVAGTWSPPRTGDIVTRPDGTERTWEAVQAGEDGWIRHKALLGGYAYAAVESEERQVWLLEATRHSMVYVNGEPRVGDTYKTGYVRLSVLLEPGTNHFLFRCGRGELRARLVELRSLVAFSADLRPAQESDKSAPPDAPPVWRWSDPTLPDLIVGEPVDVWAGVVVINATGKPIKDADVEADYAGEKTRTELPPILPWSVRKVPIRIVGAVPAEAGTQEVQLVLSRGPGGELDRAALKLRVRDSHESRKRTFISRIDGSVQYYAVQPMQSGSEHDGPPALFLTLHGASVEARGQADCYKPKSWGHVVAPTNRRPFGFDWEDWGRLDTMEVFAIVEDTLGTDPQRTYLTGHSMGGHGVWHVGAIFPDRFAAIAPSAAWISFWSYTGAARFEGATPMEEILKRATNPSDTLALSRNYLHYGVYILHGGCDEEVPVEQARTMRKHLAQYHADFAYYERPGVKHWWGRECVDWPPLFDFLENHTRPATHEIHDIEFVTASPSISATCHWATIEQQLASLKFSKIDLHLDMEKRRIHGTTENVARLSLALKVTGRGPQAEPQFILEPCEPLELELDAQKLADIPWPAGGQLSLEQRDGQWTVATAGGGSGDLDAGWRKGTVRAGPFKAVFDNRVLFVYGTCGTPEENAWAYTKARYDAETFWYRGNGSIDVVADAEFDPRVGSDRSVVLYGNADTNSAWKPLFGHSPVQVTGGRVSVGEREIAADDSAVLAIYPRKGTQRALVGVVGGSGIVGMRLTDRLPYFVSGIAYPDWIVLGPEMLREGTKGVRAAGFFGNDWTVDPEQSAWREPEK